MAWNRLGALQISEQKVRYQEYLRREKYGLENGLCDSKGDDDDDEEEEDEEGDDDQWFDEGKKRKKAARSAQTAAREREEEQKEAGEKEKVPIFPDLIEAKRAGGKMVAYIIKCGKW